MMNANNLPIPKLDKTAFSIATLFDESDAKAYWFSRTPRERLQHPELEKMRQAKRDERGGFDRKIFPIESEINEEEGA